MGRWIAGLLAILLTGFIGWWPFRQQDTGELYIVDTLLVERKEANVRLYAGEAAGRGENMTEALRDLEEQAPGQLFLRQTCRVIYCGGAEADVMDLPEDLPVGTYIYVWDRAAADLDVEKLKEVLEARERRNSDIPTLSKLENQALTGQSVIPERLNWEAEHGA